jgi:hypothetical protein
MDESQAPKSWYPLEASNQHKGSVSWFAYNPLCGMALNDVHMMYCVKQLNGTLHSEVYLKIYLPMCNYTPEPTALFENTSCLYHSHFRSSENRIRKVTERWLITYMIWLPKRIIYSYITFYVSSWCICTFGSWSNIYILTLVEFHNNSIAIYWVVFHYVTHICTLLTHWGRGHLNCLNARSRGF